MELTTHYSVLDLKTKCQPLEQVVICYNGQALSLKAKPEQSMANFAPASLCKLPSLLILDKSRSSLFSPANNHSHNETTEKHCRSFAKRYEF